MQFNLFDIILVAIFSGSIIIGMYRGFVVTSINMGSFLLTIALTITLTPLAQDIVSEHVRNSLAINIISLAVAYLLSSFACKWTAKRLKEMVEEHTQGTFDRMLGVWIGAIRGYIVCFCIFLATTIISSASYKNAENYWQILTNIDKKQYPNWLKNANLYELMEKSYNYSSAFANDSVIESYLSEIEMPVKQVENSKTKEDIQEKAIDIVK